MITIRPAIPTSRVANRTTASTTSGSMSGSVSVAGSSSFPVASRQKKTICFDVPSKVATTAMSTNRAAMRPPPTSARIAVATMTKVPMKAFGKRGRSRRTFLLPLLCRNAIKMAASRLTTMRAPTPTRIVPARCGAEATVVNNCGSRIAVAAKIESRATPPTTSSDLHC